jgi:5'-deoxynucleotidase YfbR-like HD superfamily hydrolase
MSSNGDFDISTTDEARQILQDFGRVESVPRGDYDKASGSHLIWSMGEIERRAEYEDGTFQTNAAHIGRMTMLGLMMLDFDHRTDIDRGLFSVMANIHELDEAFVGDTPHDDVKANITKPIRSVAGKLLVEEFLAPVPYLLSVHHEYHDQKTPTARYTKAMDSHETVDFALLTKATTQRKRNDVFHKWVERKLSETVRDHTVFDHTEYLVRQIGRKWKDDWGCKSFEGNPDEIVDDIKSKIFINLKKLAEDNS